MDIYRSNRNCGCLRCRYRGIMGGVVLMTVGFLFLLQNFHVDDLDFGRTWPLLLIAIGVVKMLQRAASTEGHVQPMGGMPPFPMPPSPPVPPMPGTQSSSSSSSSSSEVPHE